MDSTGRGEHQQPASPARRERHASTTAFRVRTLLGLAAASAAVFALAAARAARPRPPTRHPATSTDSSNRARSRSRPRAPTGRSAITKTAGDLVGYDVEVAEAVADKLGLEVEFEETQWDAIFAGLDAGRFDIIANQVSINPEREEQYLFSEPYTVSPGVIVVQGGRRLISSSKTSTERPPRSRSRATGTSSRRSAAPTSKPSRAGHRPSHCWSRAGSTRPSTTSSPTWIT